MDYNLIRVTSEADWRIYHAIRRAVLWEARGDFLYDDKYPDEYLPTNTPFLLTGQGQGIGTTRLDDTGQAAGIIRLVAIAADKQRQGHGRVLANMVEDQARIKGMKTLFVNAAPEAVGYYEKMGWTRHLWDAAELTGIAADCVQMRKIL